MKKMFTAIPALALVAIVVSGCSSNPEIEPSLPIVKDITSLSSAHFERCYNKDMVGFERSGRALVEKGDQHYFHPVCDDKDGKSLVGDVPSGSQLMANNEVKGNSIDLHDLGMSGESRDAGKAGSNVYKELAEKAKQLAEERNRLENGDECPLDVKDEIFSISAEALFEKDENGNYIYEACFHLMK